MDELVALALRAQEALDRFCDEAMAHGGMQQDCRRLQEACERTLDILATTEKLHVTDTLPAPNPSKMATRLRQEQDTARNSRLNRRRAPSIGHEAEAEVRAAVAAVALAAMTRCETSPSETTPVASETATDTSARPWPAHPDARLGENECDLAQGGSTEPTDFRPGAE